ncbi:hypothetical protein ACS0TY_005348 [Phlomoides rotata]
MPPSLSARARVGRAYKAMNKLGYQTTVVKPVLQELLKLYEKDWVHIENDNYQVLVDAVLDSEEQKARQEAEEIEPPSNKSKLGSKGRQSVTSFHASIPDSSNVEKNQPHVMRKLILGDEDIEPTTPRFSKYSHVKGQSSSTPLYPILEEAKETNFDNENDICNPLETLAHLKNSGDESYTHYGFSDKRMIIYESGSCNLLARNKGKLYLDDGDVELEKMEIDKPLHEAALDCEPSSCNVPSFGVPPDNAQECLKLDVASSSGGEVMIFLTAQSSPSDAHVPNLETVLKQVEEQCLKSYKIPQTGFSMLTLMKEACECFLAAGTTSTYFEDVRPIDMVSSLEISKDAGLETGLVERIDCQLSLCSTNLINLSRIQNCFEVLPQIPRFVGSSELDLSYCTIYLNVDPKRFGGMENMEINYRVPSSSRMMIVQKCYYLYITDISRGQEAYEVSLINEVNEEQGPAFNYIPRNMTYRNAYARFLLSQISEENCCSFGDCLSLEIPCACAGKIGHEFAYTTGCLLKENFLDNVISKNYSALQHNRFYCQDCPIERCKGNILSCKCKGHIEKNFIRECWHKCGCGINCGNRVVQRGITAKLQVFRTPAQKGWGLRTLEDIPKGAFICEYVGEVITSRESFERSLHDTGEKLTYPVVLDANWSSKGVLKDEEALCLDATIYGNVARIINHRCFDANLVEIPVEVETQDHSYYHLAFFATRKIDAFEELTWDYGIDFYHPVKAFQCLCGSNFCRDRRSLKRKRDSC